VLHRVLWDYSPQIHNVLFPDPQIQNSINNIKKKLPGGTTLFILFKIKNLLDAHDFSDQSTLELVTSMFLSVECTTGFANYAKATTYFLVVKGKIRRNCSLFVCKVCCSCASFHI
jgi:hypothetical protein